MSAKLDTDRIIVAIHKGNDGEAAAIRLLCSDLDIEDNDPRKPILQAFYRRTWSDAAQAGFSAASEAGLLHVNRLRIEEAIADADFVARLFTRVSPEPNTGCWLWNGKLDRKGYGVICHKRHYIAAHRAMFAANGNPLPVGVGICHKCDTPSCVNPDHLFPGTIQDNVNDMKQKGRSRTWRGERLSARNPVGKLNDEKVRYIRSAYSNGGVSYAALGRKFDVNPLTIRRVVEREIWAHVNPVTTEGGGENG